MKTYVVRMSTLDNQISDHEVSVSGDGKESLKQLAEKCKQLLLDNPGKVLKDYEVKGSTL